MERINYDDKVALYENPDIADINKVNASDMNNIKSTINGALDGTNPMGSIVVDDISGKNLLNSNNITENILISDTGVANSNSSWNLCNEYIKVNSSTQLTLNCTVSGLMQWRVYEYNSSAGWVQRQEVNAKSGTFTTSSSTAYVRIGYLKTNSPTNMQLELGNTATTYIPYMQPVKKTSVGVKEDTTFYANDFKCRNLFDKNTMIELTNQVRRYSDGNVVSVSGYYGIKVPVNANTTYVVSSSLTTRDNISNLCYFNGTTYISGEAFGSGSLSFTTPSNCNYITLAISNTFTWCQLEVGNEATSYTPYKRFDYAPVMLFDNPNGQLDDITLNDNKNNYSYLEIFFVDDQNFVNSMKIIPSYVFQLQFLKSGANRGSTYLISTRMYWSTNTLLKRGTTTIHQIINGVVSENTTADVLKVVRIIGYK